MERKKRCEYCGIEIWQVSRQEIRELTISDIVLTRRAISKFKNQKFCSTKCSQLGKLYQKREKHWNWRGGITELRPTLMATAKYKQWRKAVFRRDNYTCQICGKKGGNLEADHKKQFVLILIENNIRTTEDALNCKELWEISNGRTLCQKCHRKTFIFFGNQFTANRKNGVNSVKPRTGNTEPNLEITKGSLEV